MRPTPAALHLLAIPLLLLAACSGESEPASMSPGPSAPAKAAPKAPESELAKLVPADAAIYVEVPSIDRLSDVIRAVHKSFDPQTDSADVERALEEMDIPGSLQEIDRSKPLGLCVVLPDQSGAQPMPVFVVPARSTERFVRSVTESQPGFTTAVHGDYVMVSMGAEAKPAAAPPAIALGLPAGDLVARIDVERLVRHFRPMIEMGLGQVTAALDSMPPESTAGMDMRPFMKVYVDGILAVLDSGKTLDVAMRFEGSVLELASELSVREGSALDGFASSEKTDAKALAPLVDPQASIAMVFGMDQTKLLQRMRPLLDAVFAMYPEPLRSSFQKMMGSMDELAAHMGSAVAVNGGFGADGLRYAVYMKPRDSKKLVETYRTMMSSMTGITLDEMKEIEVEGLPALRSRLRVDPTVFAAMQPEGADPAQSAQMKAMFERMYGPDGLAFTIATQGDTTAIVLGGDESYHSTSIARMKNPAPLPPRMARGLEEVGDLNPCFVVHYDLGATMKGMQELLGPDFAAIPSVFANEPGTAFTVHGGVDGRTWRGAMSTDVSELGAAFRQMHEGMERQPAAAPAEPR